jgi:phytoene/squalene synthetase
MANLDDLLLKTSRTFALSIPMLPEPTRRHVGIAYLLFRVADTFEDAALWPARGASRLSTTSPAARNARRRAACCRPLADRRSGGACRYVELLRESPS